MTRINRTLKSLLLICAAGCAVGAAITLEPERDERRALYASIAELPDWSGMWIAAPTESSRVADAPAGPAGASAKVSGEVTPGSSCEPWAMPSVMQFASSVELLFTPGRVTMLVHQDVLVRRIYTDGRGRRPDPQPTRVGESIGRWEGETLVVYTTAITPKARLGPGVFLSSKTQVTERIYLNDRGRLQIDTMVDDATILDSPWRLSRLYDRSLEVNSVY